MMINLNIEGTWYRFISVHYDKSLWVFFIQLKMYMFSDSKFQLQSESPIHALKAWSILLELYKEEKCVCAAYLDKDLDMVRSSNILGI